VLDYKNLLKANETRKLAAIDFFGAFLALFGSALLVLALTWAGGEYSWHSAHVISTLVIGIVVSICFGLWQWKGTSVPLVPSKCQLDPPGVRYNN
jgi:phosphate/sulfate permease